MKHFPTFTKELNRRRELVRETKFSQWLFILFISLTQVGLILLAPLMTATLCVITIHAGGFLCMLYLLDEENVDKHRWHWCSVIYWILILMILMISIIEDLERKN